MKNIDVKIHSNNWEQSASPAGYVRGTVFVDGIHLHGAAIMEQLPIATDSIDKWKKALVCLNGFFSFVHIRENEIIAAVDRVRSIPIFYGTTNNKVYLSDDAEWVRLQVGDSEMDPVARDEFQLTNYVTGKDTLFPNVKQLQAGELLRITCTDKEPNVQTYRYYSFTHTEPEEWEEPTLREELGRVTEAAFQRLIQYADGRQIVVPLSGGYDSRLIVAMLKRLSNRTHTVYTGFTICCLDKNTTITRAVATQVKFKQLTDREIEWYTATEEPFDKAGAYAIQGLGTFLVKSIDGSYTNVVGLPVCEVIEILLEQGVITLSEMGNNDE